MAAIQLLGLGIQGRSPNLTAQRRQNLYLDVHQVDRDKTLISAHPTPGLTLFKDFGDAPVRGLIVAGNLLYAVHRGTFYEINNAGISTSRGTLDTTSGRVGMAENGAQILIVDGAQGYVYTIATTTLAKIVDVDFPGGDTATFLDGYFIVNKPNDTEFHLSALYAGANWLGQIAEAEAKPDKIVRVFEERGALIIFGEYSTEVWQNTGALDFPFLRVNGATSEWGLAARWSACKFEDSVVWLGRNRLGEVSAVRSEGFEVRRISSPDLDHLFSDYSSISDATGLSYTLDGHPMWQLNFPQAMESWLYDGLNGSWSRLVSFDETRHRAEIQVSFIDKPIVSDFENGKLYRLDKDALTDNGDPIVRELIAPHLSLDLDQTPFTLAELRLDMETGVGTSTGQGAAPSVMLSVSRDRGHSWGVERWKPIGPIGEFAHQVRWRRLGRCGDDVVFRLRISDPVKVTLIAASASIAP